MGGCDPIALSLTKWSSFPRKSSGLVQEPGPSILHARSSMWPLSARGINVRVCGQAHDEVMHILSSRERKTKTNQRSHGEQLEWSPRWSFLPPCKSLVESMAWDSHFYPTNLPSRKCDCQQTFHKHQYWCWGSVDSTRQEGSQCCPGIQRCQWCRGHKSCASGGSTM